jgi:N-methylhydantoinase A/oxoprolinase/acetone carboxylase beta subunit
VVPIDDASTIQVIERLAALDVEAVAVCLLWSIANPAHELRVGGSSTSTCRGAHTRRTTSIPACASTGGAARGDRRVARRS